MRLFHGTFHNLSGAVRPGDDVGHSNHGDTGSEDGQPSRKFAFATGSEEHAWKYASKWATGRSRVYEVSAPPSAEKGVYHEVNNEYRAPEFPIKKQIDIMPGRQGTIPINWHQFAPHKYPDDVNHPSPASVAYGPPGAKRGYTPRLGDSPAPDSMNWNSDFSRQKDTIPGL